MTPSRLVARIGRLPRAAAVGLGLTGLALMGWGGVAGYRAYDFVQHDNDFCMSCHLMAEPYEQFAESEHRGLGCKACHQPTLLARSQMALTQIVENPSELAKHAEVTNETCASCHIEGDPEKWRVISNSAGHRIHLESDDPNLTGLQCVECHATSIHEFAPSDRTCSQAGCHEENEVRLGGMSRLTIHCAACHNFVAPVDAQDGEAPRATTGDTPGAGPGDRALTTFAAAIRPDSDDCLSCHVMRTLVDLPDPDPHGGVCASCHNPHEHEDPGEAVGSCATAACHSSPEQLTPLHLGLEPPVLDDCLSCHQAHDFAASGGDCVTCHASGSLDAQPGEFLHPDHEGVECSSCHTSLNRHGALSVVSVEDCRSCHHTAPEADPCSSCHAPSDPLPPVIETVRSMAFTVNTAVERALPFDHELHGGLDCAGCHTEGIARGASQLDCTACHQDHHTAESDCASCHQPAPLEAHPPSEAHVTCSGASCHQELPFEGLPRTRPFCLGCHQDQVDHRPGETCADCHTLPAPRGGG